MVGKIVQKRKLLLDALLDFRQWFEDDIFAENRVMRIEIDDAMRVVKDL